MSRHEALLALFRLCYVTLIGCPPPASEDGRKRRRSLNRIVRFGRLRYKPLADCRGSLRYYILKYIRILHYHPLCSVCRELAAQL